jgi:hypothetical protein
MGSKASTPAPVSSGMEIKYGAPTGAANRYATPTIANPYLTSSQYSDMQQHTPSGMYYKDGKFYEPYTVGTKTVQTGGGNNYNPMQPSFGWNPNGFGGGGSYNAFSNYSQPTYATVPDILAGSVQSGSQYFKPFAGNAQGIINGNLSMAAMSGQNTYQPQAMANLFAGLLAPSETAQQGGVGRFTGTPSQT